MWAFNQAMVDIAGSIEGPTFEASWSVMMFCGLILQGQFSVTFKQQSAGSPSAAPDCAKTKCHCLPPLMSKEATVKRRHHPTQPLACDKGGLPTVLVCKEQRKWCRQQHVMQATPAESLFTYTSQPILHP